MNNNINYLEFLILSPNLDVGVLGGNGFSGNGFDVNYTDLLSNIESEIKNINNK